LALITPYARFVDIDTESWASGNVGVAVGNRERRAQYVIR
jgi:hypothetical protein